MNDIMTDDTEIVLESALQIADIHAQRLNYAIEQLRQFIPATPGFFESVSNEHILLCDAFMNRLAKLQDLMGAKIFGLVLQLSEEPLEGLTFIDKLNALEKIGCIPDAHKWRDLRKMRNFLSHEYPDDFEGMAKHFNEAFELSPYLLECLEKTKIFVQETIKKRKAL